MVLKYFPNHTEEERKAILWGNTRYSYMEIGEQTFVEIEAALLKAKEKMSEKENA